MQYTFINIAESNELQLHAARILTSTFIDKGNVAWPDISSAIKEVDECIQEPNICIGLCEKDTLLGWVGLRPIYDKTWELHPLVVKTQNQRRGIGTLLINEIEIIGKEKGIIGIMLGTDDEYEMTSLSRIDITEKNIFREIESIKNIEHHPFEFYKKCGYMIVGIIPNANGIRKPDILMWKSMI